METIRRAHMIPALLFYNHIKCELQEIQENAKLKTTSVSALNLPLQESDEGISPKQTSKKTQKQPSVPHCVQVKI